MSQRSCAICGAAYQPRSGRARYCNHCSPPRRDGKRRGDRRRLIECDWCRVKVWVTKRTARFCSNRCYQDHKLSLRPRPSTELVHVGPLPRPAWTPEESSSGRLWVAGRCRRCDSPFVIVDQTANVYCSLRCSRADAKDRRRSRVRKHEGQERVHRRRIFDRDGWRCQLCGRKVNRAAKAPHPKAPVLDHVVPVSEGGAHVPSNVQCAHFLCNSAKRNDVYGAGEQLRLVG